MRSLVSIRDARSSVDLQAVADAAGVVVDGFSSAAAAAAAAAVAPVVALALAPGGVDQYLGLESGVLMKLEGPEGEVRVVF